MNETKGARNCPEFSQAFYGTATVGERGQIVIPVEARNQLGMQPGEKLLIMRHPAHHGLMVFKLEVVQEFLDEFAKSLEELKQKQIMEEGQ